MIDWSGHRRPVGDNLNRTRLFTLHIISGMIVEAHCIVVPIMTIINPHATFYFDFRA